MSDQNDVRSPRDVDVDAERFIDDDVEEAGAPVARAVDLPPEGSVPDIIDQHTQVPGDDEP